MYSYIMVVFVVLSLNYIELNGEKIHYIFFMRMKWKWCSFFYKKQTNFKLSLRQ